MDMVDIHTTLKHFDTFTNQTFTTMTSQLHMYYLQRSGVSLNPQYKNINLVSKQNLILSMFPHGANINI